MAYSSASFCLFILLSFTVSSLAHLKSYATSEIESEFKTKGGSHCEYMEVHDADHSAAALLISCECGSRSAGTLKYSCLYLGNPDICPQYEENRILFYKEIANVFESKFKKRVKYKCTAGIKQLINLMINPILCLFPFHTDHEPHACILDEIDASEHTTACKGYPVLMKKRLNEGDDPLQCSGHTEL